jgi:prepilin-type N-terminal cleavage/methylation domain-containing protein
VNAVNLFRSDDGLTLLEVLIAMSISTLLAMGIGQMFTLGVKAMQYSSTTSSTTVKKTNFARVFADDVQAANSFYVAGASPGTTSLMTKICSTWTSTLTNFSTIRPLLTLEQGDGTEVGYEVRRTSSGAGEIWRVWCATKTSGPTANRSALMLSGVAAPTGTTDAWADTFTCSGTVTAQFLAFATACPTYTSIADLTTNLGIKFTPAPSGATPLPVQAVIGSRSDL